MSEILTGRQRPTAYLQIQIEIEKPRQNNNEIYRISVQNQLQITPNYS